MQDEQLLFPFYTIQKNRYLVNRVHEMMSCNNPSKGMFIIGEEKSGKTTILKEIQEFGDASIDWFFVRGDQEMTAQAERDFEYFLTKPTTKQQVLIVDDVDVLIQKHAIIEARMKDFYDKEAFLIKTFLLFSTKKDFSFKMKDLASRATMLEKEHLTQF